MKVYLILVITAIIFGCVTQKDYSGSKHNISEIRFGSSGGFTGLGNTYVIKPDGGVFKETSDSLRFLNQLDNKDFKRVRNKLAEADFKNIGLLEKGNMTYFIEVNTAAWQHKVTWSGQTQHDNIKNLYQTLVKTLKKP